jgi:hypothetical protein
MNSNDKANYYDNLNNSTIKASKRLTNTAINQMPVEANFIQAEAPQDYDGIFDKAVDLYNSLIIHSKEIYQYFNESPEFYPKDSKQGIQNKVNKFQLSGAGRLVAKHRLKGGFNRLLNAERTPRYTEYMMGKQYPIRSRLFGGMLHGGVDPPPESSSDEEAEPEPVVNQYIQHPYLAVLKKAQLNFLLNTYYSTDGLGIPHENYSRKNEQNLRIMLSKIATDWTQPQYAITLTREQIRKLGSNGPAPTRKPRAPQPQVIDVEAIDDRLPPEPDPNQPLDIDNVALAKGYNFELNPILGIVNKILLTIKNLYRYEKYLLKNYEFIKPEDGETLKDIYNELCQNFVYILHIVDYFEENNATMDNELNYKTMDALRQLLNNYKKVITNLINILEAKNFDIEVVPEVENYQPDDNFAQLLRNLDKDIDEDLDEARANRNKEAVPPETWDIFGPDSDDEGGPQDQEVLPELPEYKQIAEVIVQYFIENIQNPMYTAIPPNQVDDIFKKDVDELNLKLGDLLKQQLDYFKKHNISMKESSDKLSELKETYDDRLDSLVEECNERLKTKEQDQPSPEALQHEEQGKQIVELLTYFDKNKTDPPKPEGITRSKQKKIKALCKSTADEAEVLRMLNRRDNKPAGELLTQLEGLKQRFDQDYEKLFPSEDLSNSLIGLLQGLPPPPKKEGSGRKPKKVGGNLRHIQKQMEYQKQYPGKGMLYQHRNPAYRRDNILELINKYPIDQLDNLTKYLL